MSDFQPPPGALDVSIPRTPTRILCQTFLVHLAADFAFTHLHEVAPRFRADSLPQRCLQVLLFWHAPELLLIQIVSTLLAGLIEEYSDGEGSDSGSSRRLQLPAALLQFAEFAGLRAFRRRRHVDAVRRSLLASLPVLGASLAFCWLGVAAYAARFHISYHNATDVGNLGLDHRNGWVAAAGLLAAVLAAGYRAYVWHYVGSLVAAEGPPAVGDQEGNCRPEEEEEEKDGDDDDDDEHALAELESGIGEVAPFNLSLDASLRLLEAFVASIVHQIPLLATHRRTAVLRHLPPLLILIACLVGVAAKQSRPWIARRAAAVLRWAMMGIIAWTIVEPSVHDINELYDASAAVVNDWTIRWKATDPFDRLLRPFI